MLSRSLETSGNFEITLLKGLREIQSNLCGKARDQGGHSSKNRSASYVDARRPAVVNCILLSVAASN